MASFRVYVTGIDADDVSVGSWFTLEADDDVDAANEAVTAARDCGWTDTETTRVILADHRPTASDRIRAARDRDEHSGSRRLEVLEEEAPQLIAAPDAVADLHRYAHELADAAINGAAGGYADSPEDSDARSERRADLETRLYSIARLETIRGELRAERVSYGELAELQSLAAYIEPDDVELLEAAGIPEHDDDATE